ncbi:MAG: hypothetical protein D3906_04185 [Candidatus Electrothrix sp. AUS1_2]|nr:hypothetical protein [Candidatus Electrothrix sp. AUS1_2]
MKFKKIKIVLLGFFAVATFIIPSYASLAGETVNIYIHLIRDKEDDLNKTFQDKLLKKFKDTEYIKFNVKFGSTRNDLTTAGGFQDVDWIIYIGHGNSCTGEIASEIKMDKKGNPVKDENGDFKHNMISPSELAKSDHWKLVKGVLIFGCAVVDIGDFGWQNVIGGGEGKAKKDNCEKGWNERGINGNYCRNYFRIHYGDENSCSNYSEKYYGSDDFPDPGLKWEDLAKENGIKYILGFNFLAPLIKNGGEKLLMNFLSKWLDYYIANNDIYEYYFYVSWKSKLNEKREDKINLWERSYIKCTDSAGNFSKNCMYSMGRSNNLSQNETYKDYDIFWPSIWNEVWSDSGWTDFGKYRPVWPGGKNNDMSIDDYRDCIFSDVENDKPLIPSEAAMHIRELCLRDIVSKDNDKFNPSIHVNRLEWAKMVRRGAGPELIPEDEKYEPDFIDYNSKTCPNGKVEGHNLCWAYDYIRDLRAKGVVEGFSDGLRPTDNTERSHILKFVVKAFWGDHAEKNCGDYENIEGFTDAGDPDWFCHYLAAAINCKLIDPSSKDDQQLFPGISETKIDPKHEVTRAEIAILVNRARRVKETSVDETCYP